MPHGEVKVTMKVPAARLMEVMVNFIESASDADNGSASTMMSDQLRVAALTVDESTGLPKLATMGAAPPLSIVNSLSLRERVQPPLLRSFRARRARADFGPAVGVASVSDVGGGVDVG